MELRILPGVSYLVQPASLTVTILGVSVTFDAPGTSDAMTFLFVTLLVVPGAVGQAGSLWALMTENTAAWLGWPVFGCACTLIVMATLVIAVSVASAAAETRESQMATVEPETGAQGSGLVRAYFAYFRAARFTCGFRRGR